MSVDNCYVKPFKERFCEGQIFGLPEYGNSITAGFITLQGLWQLSWKHKSFTLRFVAACIALNGFGNLKYFYFYFYFLLSFCKNMTNKSNLKKQRKKTNKQTKQIT